MFLIVMSAPESPLLTILLPVRNEEMNLRIMLRIIRTVLDYPHEVLVIHDTLDDRSIPIVEEVRPNYSGLRLVHNQFGRGAINAVRAGVAEAQSDIVTILCADDTGPVLVVDDMDLTHHDDEQLRSALAVVRHRLLGNAELVCAELGFSSGVIVAVKRRP